MTGPGRPSAFRCSGGSPCAGGVVRPRKTLTISGHYVKAGPGSILPTFSLYAIHATPGKATRRTDANGRSICKCWRKYHGAGG